MAASWPTSVATDTNLYLAVNELQTNLSAGINNAVTTVGLNSVTSFPTVGLVLIDNEIIKYTGISGNNLTGCTRAFDSTTAASHSSGAVVSFAFCATHHNVLKDEIEAIETYLSNNLGTGSQPLATGSRALASSAGGKITESSVTSTELGYVSGVTSAIQTQLNGKQASGTYVANPMTADLAAGTHKLTGLSAGSTNGDSVRYEQVIGVYLPLTGGTVTGSTTFSSTSGNPIHGISGNTAVAAGYVGEYIESVVSNVNSGSSGQYADLTNIALTAGIWMVTLVAHVSRNGATSSGSSAYQVGVSQTSGNSSTGLVLGSNLLYIEPTEAATLSGESGGVIPGYYQALSGNVTVYAKIRAEYTGGPPTWDGRLSAIRIA